MENINATKEDGKFLFQVLTIKKISENYVKKFSNLIPVYLSSVMADKYPNLKKDSQLLIDMLKVDINAQNRILKRIEEIEEDDPVRIAQSYISKRYKKMCEDTLSNLKTIK